VRTPDLHHKNILLCSLPVEKGCYVYYHKGVAYYNQTCIVKIAGVCSFSLSDRYSVHCRRVRSLYLSLSLYQRADLWLMLASMVR
jgi:hypothetical protein